MAKRPRTAEAVDPAAEDQTAPSSGSSYGLRPALRESLLPSYVDVAAARGSRVMRAPGLLTSSDLALIADVRVAALASEDAGTNNPQNQEHDRKVCTFLNRDPGNPIRRMAPHILAKLLRFADRAWGEAAWGGDDQQPGPLHGVAGGVRSLSIRVVEHWEYSVGGALVDPWHYDPGSVVTIVGLLSDGFEGGVFRTHEPSGEHLEHPMAVGDVICFVSHKYHNVTPVTAGTRRSIVMELWEGGLPFAGRREFLGATMRDMMTPELSRKRKQAWGPLVCHCRRVPRPSRVRELLAPLWLLGVAGCAMLAACLVLEGAG